MIRLIINADDLGVNPMVNKEIEQALHKNFISSSTILANSEYLDDVKRITDTFCDTKSFGVHLNITEGKSMTNNSFLRDAGFIDSNGYFIKENNFQSRLYEDNIILAVQQEWDAQVYEVLSKGIKISHVDGHHHCHTWYGYSKALKSVMEKYGITKVRNTYTSPYLSFKDKVMGGLSRRFLDLHLIDASRRVKTNRLLLSIRCHQDNIHFKEETKAFVKTDFFDSYESIFGRIMRKKLDLVMPEDAIIELMCHPGHPIYENEFKYIMNDAIRIKQNPNMQLIDYNEL